MQNSFPSKALIIAAGRGIRLNSHSQEIPKSLISVGDKSILETILAILANAGIKEVVIVTGYKHDVLAKRIGDGKNFGLQVKYVYNSDWQKKNGVSVFAARGEFSAREPFLLMMSDHIFSPAMLDCLLQAPLGSQEVMLAVDRKISEIYDIDDAMKVEFDGRYILKMGKELAEYNAIDCGLFKATTNLFNALEAAMQDGDCSLSDGCQILIRQSKMLGVDIGDEFWIDIDTPEALAYAIEKLSI